MIYILLMDISVLQRHCLVLASLPLLPNIVALQTLLFLWRIATTFYLSTTVVDQLHRPAALVLDPDEDASVCVACGELLEGLVPPHQDHLKGERERGESGDHR